MTKEKPIEKIKELGASISKQILKGDNPAIDVPIRALSNVFFDKKSKTLQLGESSSKRSFFNIAHAKKFLQTVEVAKIEKDLLDSGKHASLRDVFYMAKRTIPNTSVNLVDMQQESDEIIQDLELISGLSREQLHVNANKMGSVAGNVVIEDRGDTIDWGKLGSGGWSIPSNVEEIKFKKVNANFVLYMEKAAIFERLLEDKFHEKQKGIILSSQGQTTRGIRRLLQRLYEEFELPIYVLADLDPWGAYIYSVIKYGSINLAFFSKKLTIPSVKYLGITCNDVERYNLKKNLIKLKDTDIKRMQQIADYEWFKDNKEWQNEFKIMKKWGAKAEIQALSARGISFITDKYLPEKLKNKDFLE